MNEQQIDPTDLVAQYGKAMLRVGQLEQQVTDLQTQLKQVSQSQRSAPARDPAQGSKSNANNATVASMRVQLSTLAGQLARTEEKLKEAAEGNYARIRQRHNRSLWRKVRGVVTGQR